MSFKELELNSSYSSDTNDVLFDFYIPVLKESIKYKRLAGFFTSNSIAVASKGIYNLIKNEGKIFMIVSPKLNASDQEIIIKAKENPELFVEKNFSDIIINSKEGFEREPLKVLGWMIANDILKIKVALIYDENNNLLNAEEVNNKGIFHQKIGILYDEAGDVISFSGSINETANAWLNNIEEFKVFKSWDHSKVFLETDLKKFERFWKGKSPRVKTIDMPEAVKNKLISIAPDSIDDINWEHFSKIDKSKTKNKIEPRSYQKEAINFWFNNNCKGIIEMATGTGKTYMSLLAIKRYIKENPSKNLIIINCPYQHLVDQWENSIKDIFGDIEIVKCYKNINKWYDELILMIQNLIFNNIEFGFIITTPNSGSKPEFIKLLNSDKINKVVVVDEVHNIGAENNKKFLKTDAQARMGLSATPIRPYDEEGNKAISKYFGKSKNIIDIKQAIEKDFLVPYEYDLSFCILDEEEYEQYRKLTTKVARLYSKKDTIEEDHLLKILIERSKIISKCNEKLLKFREILRELSHKNEKNNLLVYTAENQEFFNNTLRILQEEGFKTLKIVGSIENDKRLDIIEKHKNQDIDCILAMRCLDEGVDIPSSDKSIILSSSTNSKQYIQRRGRVLRKFDKGNKTKAIIYDFLVLPPRFQSETDKNLFKRELKRIFEFSSTSKNDPSIFNNLYNYCRNNGILKEFSNIIWGLKNESKKY